MGIEREPSNYQNYRALALAICAQACDEYIYALRSVRAFEKIKHKDLLPPEEIKAYERLKSEIYDCEEFFKSQWFYTLTEGTLDGVDVIRKLKEKSMNSKTKREIRFEKLARRINFMGESRK